MACSSFGSNRCKAAPAVVLAPLLGGLLAVSGCGRTEFVFSNGDTELDTLGTTGDPTDGTTGGPTTGLDTGRPEMTGPGTTAITTGFDETGFPGTSTTGPSTTTGPGTTTTTTGPGTTTTDPSTSTTDTDGGTTDVSTTDGGTTDVSTTDGGTTDGGTTDGTTDGGTTDGGTTDGGTTGGDPTCLDAVDCVLACGGPSPGCINACDNDLPPDENADFQALEFCIIFACITNGSCPPGGFGQPACVACRLDGQLDPTTAGCEDEAMACAM